MVKTKCPICGSINNSEILYKANFSQGDINAITFSARRMPDRRHFRIVVCKNDGLVRADPIINSGKLQELYKKSHFTYESEVEFLAKTYLMALKNVLGKISYDEDILEVGCANGFMIAELSKLGYKNVWGLEPSMDAAGKASRRFKKKIIRDILRPNVFDANRFGLVFLLQTFDHLADPGAFLKEIRRILAPGGYLVVFNHDIESIFAKVLGERSPVIDVEHPFFYSRQTIKKLFEKHHLGVLKAYSPKSIVSLRHLIWFAPIPKFVKEPILNLGGRLLSKSIKLKLGNLCVIAVKEAN